MPAAADTFTYDLLGRVSTQLSADGKLTTYSYDAAGNRTSVVTTATAANRPPVAVNDAAGLNEGVASLTFDPRTNDSDPDGQPITIVGSSVAQLRCEPPNRCALWDLRGPGARYWNTVMCNTGEHALSSDNIS